MPRSVRSKLLCATLLAAAFGAQAAESELNVTGHVLPSSCTLSVAGGGFTLNTVSSGNLGPGPVNLRPVTVPANVFCGSPTKVLLRFHDNAVPWGERPHFKIVNRRNPAQTLGSYQVSLLDPRNGVPGERMVRYMTPNMIDHSSIAHANAVSSLGMGPLREPRVTRLPFNMLITPRIESSNPFRPIDAVDLYGAMSVSLFYL